MKKFKEINIRSLFQKDLKSKSIIIKIDVFSNNKPAKKLYQKQGFKKVATIPDQFEHQKKLINQEVMLLYL